MRNKIFFASLALIPILFYINDTKVEMTEISKKLIACSNTNSTNFSDCTKNIMQTKLSIKDINTIITLLNDEYKDNIEFSKICHEITHIIGEEAYIQHKDKALIKNLESCGEGFIHGVMTNFQNNENGVVKLVKFCENFTINNRSSDINDLSIDTNALCYHGIGHSFGANFIIDENKIDYSKSEFINKNYIFCKNVLNYFEKKYKKINRNILASCFYGGYSEYLKRLLNYNNKKADYYFINKKDFNDCNVISDFKTIIYCYRITTIYKLKLISKEFISLNHTDKEISNNKLVSKVSNFCKSLLKEEYISGCIEGLAVYYVSEFFNNKDSLNGLLVDPAKINYLLDTVCGYDIEERCKNTFLNDFKNKTDGAFYNNILNVLED